MMGKTFLLINLEIPQKSGHLVPKLDPLCCFAIGLSKLYLIYFKLSTLNFTFYSYIVKRKKVTKLLSC